MNERHDIASFIPQRPPFVLIDTIDEVGINEARTRYTIPATCPLVHDGILPLAGLLENAAQSCAVLAGNTISYLGAVKQMDVVYFPHVGEMLDTEAIVKQEMLNIKLIECTIRVLDETIATVTLKIATINDDVAK